MLLAPAHRSSGERRMSQRQNAAIAAPAQLLEGPGCGLPWHQLTAAPANAGRTSAKSSRPRIQLLLRDRAAVHPGAGSYQIWRVQGEPAPDRRGSSSSCLGDRGCGSPQRRLTLASGAGRASAKSSPLEPPLPPLSHLLLFSLFPSFSFGGAHGFHLCA